MGWPVERASRVAAAGEVGTDAAGAAGTAAGTDATPASGFLSRACMSRAQCARKPRELRAENLGAMNSRPSFVMLVLSDSLTVLNSFLGSTFPLFPKLLFCIGPHEQKHDGTPGHHCSVELCKSPRSCVRDYQKGKTVQQLVRPHLCLNDEGDVMRHDLAMGRAHPQTLCLLQASRLPNDRKSCLRAFPQTCNTLCLRAQLQVRMPSVCVKFGVALGH